MLETVNVHGLVDHAVNLAISAEWKPTDTIFSINVFHLRKQFRKPARRLRAEQFHVSRIEEEKELIHLNSENPGKKEMPEFMDSYEYRQGKDDLNNFHQNRHTLNAFFNTHLRRSAINLIVCGKDIVQSRRRHKFRA